MHTTHHLKEKPLQLEADIHRAWKQAGQSRRCHSRVFKVSYVASDFMAQWVNQQSERRTYPKRMAIRHNKGNALTQSSDLYLRD